MWVRICLARWAMAKELGSNRRHRTMMNWIKSKFSQKKEADAADIFKLIYINPVNL